MPAALESDRRHHLLILILAICYLLSAALVVLDTRSIESIEAYSSIPDSAEIQISFELKIHSTMSGITTKIGDALHFGGDKKGEDHHKDKAEEEHHKKEGEHKEGGEKKKKEEEKKKDSD